MDNFVAPSGGSVPMVVEFDESAERSFDLYSKLLSHRVVFLGTAIDDAVQTWSSLGCCIWKPRIPTRTSRSTSTRQVDR